MPEAVAVAIVEYAEVAIVGEMVLTAAQVAMAATALQAVGAVAYLRYQQRKSESAARDSYNAGLRDRYAMVRGATEQRQIVLGRQRVSGPVGFIRSYGANQSKLVYTVVLAAHEIDATEAAYFNDEPVVVDGGGNVVGISRHETFSIAAATAAVTLTATPASGTVSAVAKYGSTSVALTVGTITGASVSVSGAHPAETGLLIITYQPDPNPYAPAQTTSAVEVFTQVTGTDTFTLASPPLAGSVSAAGSNGATGDARQDYPLGASLSGADVTISGGNAGDTCIITYQTTSAASKARGRIHAGAPGQTADSEMVANLPGVWTSAHVGAGLAYLAVELDYDEAAFSSGAPQISAIVRGLKCFDPRSGLTAWTENPALLMRAYAIHPLGGRLDSSMIDDVSVIAAANICDTSTAYTVGGKTFTRPLYTAGLTARTGQRPQDILNDLASAMGGRWIFSDGKLRIMAGAYSAPVMALDATWLHNGGAVTVQPTRNRADMINAAQGTFADETTDYQVTQYPRIVADAYVTADGAELPSDLNFPAITWAGQAQYVASSQIKYARQGLTVKLTCNMKAYQAEPFDTISVTLDRFGWASKPFEVLDTRWTIDGGIELTLKETAPSIWDLGAGFTAIDPAPNTALPVSWGLPLVEGLTLNGNQAIRLSDGTVVPRIKIAWDAQTDPRITIGGRIEIRGGVAGDPEEKLGSVLVPGASTEYFVDNVADGVTYVVKARTVSSTGFGDWCQQKTVIASKRLTPPSDVTGLAWAIKPSQVVISWDTCPDSDYADTELRLGPTDWDTSARLWDGKADDWKHPRPANGTYRVWAAHRNFSGIYSGTPVYVDVTVDDSIDPGAITSGGYTFTFEPLAEIVLPVDVNNVVTSFAQAKTNLRITKLDGTDGYADWAVTKTDTNVTSTLGAAGQIAITAIAQLGGVASLSAVTITPPADWQLIYSYVWTGQRWVMFGRHSTANWSSVMTSPDFVTWTAVATGQSAGWQFGASDDNGTVISTDFRTVSNKLMRSTDHGATWSAVTLPASIQHYSLDCSGAAWVIVNNALSGFRSTDGGLTWTGITLPASGGNVKAGGSRWVCAASSGAVMVSADDGATWTLAPGAVLAGNYGSESIVYHGLIIVAQQNTTSTLRVSEDGGQTWVSVTTGAPYSLPKTMTVINDVCYMVGSDGKLHYSTDGYSWACGAGTPLTGWSGTQAGSHVYASFTGAYIPYLIQASNIAGRALLTATSNSGGHVGYTCARAGASDVVKFLPVRKGVSALTDVYTFDATPGTLYVPATRDGLINAPLASLTLTALANKNGADNTSAWSWRYVASSGLTPSSGTGNVFTVATMTVDSAQVTFYGSKPGQPEISGTLNVVKNKGTINSGPRVGASYAPFSQTANYLGLRFATDGQFFLKVGSGGPWVPAGDWYLPNNFPGITSLYVKVNESGSALDNALSATRGTFLQMNTNRDFILTGTSGNTYTTAIEVIFALDASGNGAVLSTGSMKLIVP